MHPTPDLHWWVDACELISIYFEVLGVFRMARRYTNMATFFLRITILWSALFRGTVATGAATLGDRNREQALDVLQGLAFIAVGFLLRSVPHIVGIIRPELLYQ
jgi:hypothetical protein